MRLIILLLLSFLSFNEITAQNIQTFQKAKNHIKILSSKEFFGRGYVKNGQKKASEYLAKELKKLGVKSFENQSFDTKKFENNNLKNNYTQKFNMPVNTFPTPIFLKINAKKLQVGKDFIMRSNSKSAKGEGKIYYLDSIFWANKNKNELVNELFDNKKNQKFVLVFHTKYEKEIKNLPKNIIDFFQKNQVKIILFDKKPTASISLYPENESIFEMTKENFEKYNSPTLKSGVNSNEKNDVFFQIENDFVEKYSCQNIIGYTEGTSPTQKDTFLVFSAHYDHLGGMGQAFFPGASDNASGVGMVLALAEYFQKNPLKYSVAYMFFGAEEAGIIGSNYYVNNPIFPLKNIKLLLNLDLLATGSMGFTLVNGTIFKDYFDKMVQLNDKLKAVPKVFSRGKAMNSDHYFFSEKGVPAFFLYTMGNKTFYHDVDDTFESLPFDRFEQIFGLLCKYFEELEIRN